jgi:hypothetical protein
MTSHTPVLGKSLSGNEKIVTLCDERMSHGSDDIPGTFLCL